MTDPTRVLIIDDHPLFRRGLGQLLELADGIHEMLRQRRMLRQHHAERMNERTIMLARLMGLTDEQIDALWEAAIKL